MYYTITTLSDVRYCSVGHYGAAEAHEDRITVYRGNHQIGDDRVEVRAWSTRPFVSVLVERADTGDGDVSAVQSLSAPWAT